MKILYIVPNPPSLVRVRPYNLIRHLEARGHKLTIGTVYGNEQERGEIEHLREQGHEVIGASLTKQQVLRNLLAALLKRAPLQARYAFSPRLAARLYQQMTEAGSVPDLIHIEHLRGAVYFDTLTQVMVAQHQQIPLVWDSVDCISHLFRQAARESYSLKGRLMARIELAPTIKYERLLLSVFDHTLVTSKVDMEALQHLVPSSQESFNFGMPKLTVLPNGVDLSYFTPVYREREAKTIIFSGKMSYHANVTAALYLTEQIMPLVWDRCPDARLVIAGKDPSAQVMSLAERYPGRVEVTGTVADMRHWLWRATVAAVPIVYGAGIQNKVLEAMACGTPVVASHRATMPLQVLDKTHLLTADSPTDFASALLHLLGDHDLRLRLALAGRQYVENHHDWDAIAQQLETVYFEVVKAKQKS